MLFALQGLAQVCTAWTKHKEQRFLAHTSPIQVKLKITDSRISATVTNLLISDSFDSFAPVPNRILKTRPQARKNATHYDQKSKSI
ncbi:MAG: hypothetical protein A2Y73_04855 [Chloroflexi bacterium RBG_13_56_8]|nr:MAG: hypothetical protein A2Y73_04855 [Chloroflexi bacterium RBG_13_56_8]